MISPKLVLHPAPHPTESLPGYILRLSEMNGYASPQNLYRLAEMTAGQRSLTRFDCSRIAAITNQATSDVNRLAFTRPGNEPDRMRLLGNTVSVKDLNLTNARVCPECVTDLGFIEAHWHLQLMVACPIHGRTAIWFCGKCRGRLSWNRPGLLTCRCETPLLIPPRGEYSKGDLWLLDLIRRKAIGDPTDDRQGSDLGMPASQLASMNLHSLLSLIRFLGKYRLNARRSSKWQSRHVLQAAAKVLADWPSNFEILLEGICPQKSFCVENGLIALAADLSNIYEMVSQRFELRSQRCCSFTR